MIVSGLIKDAKKGDPLPGAEVSLYIGQEELAVITSNDNGEFEHSVEDSYIGQTLACEVKKEGYITQKITHEVQQDEVNLDIIRLARKEGIVIPDGWWTKLWKWLKQNKIVIGIVAAIIVVTIVIIILVNQRRPYPENLPDLVVASLEHSPKEPSTEDTITFTATVENIGSETAGPSVLDLKVGGQSTPTSHHIPALTPGKTYPIKQQVKLTVPQLYRNTATADAKKQIVELDEKNNTKMVNCRVVHVAIKEDCVQFNPNTARARLIRGKWRIVDGNHYLFDFGNKRDEAELALKIIKHYKMDQSCFVGRPDPSFKYMLASGRKPQGTFPNEDSISFNPNTVEVKRINGSWKIVDGSHYLFDFKNKQDEAELSLKIIKKYGFTKTCYVGRPDPSFTYLK